MKTFNHQSGQYLNIDSGKIYYEMAGNENKPILLVLHGGFGTMEDLNMWFIYLPINRSFTIFSKWSL